MSARLNEIERARRRETNVDPTCGIARPCPRHVHTARNRSQPTKCARTAPGRAWTMVPPPRGRGHGTQADSMRWGRRCPYSMRRTCPSQRSCRRVTYLSMELSPSCRSSVAVDTRCFHVCLRETRDRMQNTKSPPHPQRASSYSREKKRDGQNTEEVGKITRELMKEDRIQNTRLKNPTV